MAVRRVPDADEPHARSDREAGDDDARDAKREQRAIYAIVTLVFGAIAIGVAARYEELDSRAVGIVALALIATLALVRRSPAELPSARTRR